FDIALILEDLHGGDRLPAVKNDITISFRKSSRHLEGRIEYDTRLFRRETIERFHGHFTALLAAALDNPQALVGSLEMVTPEERRRRSEEHTSELQSLRHLVCRLL